MKLMAAAEELIRAQERGERTPPVEVIHQAVINPGTDEARLPTRADRIRVIQCEISGDLVPFNFDSTTGTLDLPEHLRGQEVKVTYTTIVSDPNILKRTYQEIHRQEVERQVRDEWNRAWNRSDLLPVERDEREVEVIGQTGSGPYRSSKIVRYRIPEEPWYARLWLWFKSCWRRTWA